MKIIPTKSEVVDFCLDAELNFHLVMGDDDTYTGRNVDAIEHCIEYGHLHQEEASRGVMHIRLNDQYRCLRIEFTVA